MARLDRLKQNYAQVQNSVKIAVVAFDEFEINNQEVDSDKRAVKFEDGPLSPIREESSRDGQSNL